MRWAALLTANRGRGNKSMNYRLEMPLISLQREGRLAAGALVVALAIGSIGRAAEMRTWTSATGSHTTEAEFVELVCGRPSTLLCAHTAGQEERSCVRPAQFIRRLLLAQPLL